MNEDFRKKYGAAIFTGLLLVIINVAIIIWYVVPQGPKQWEDNVVPGKIYSLSETSLVTVDPRGQQKEFILTPETSFFAGKTTISVSDLTLGALVLIEIDTASTVPPVAQEVRVLTDKRKVKDIEKAQTN